MIGVDPARVMRRVATLATLAALVNRRAAASVRYLPGTAEALDLPDCSATVAWSIATVHHWSGVAQGLDEVRRVLQPGGRFVAIERLSPPGARGHASHGWTEQQAAAFAAACTEHAFTQVRVELHQRGRRRTVSVTATRP